MTGFTKYPKSGFHKVEQDVRDDGTDDLEAASLGGGARHSRTIPGVLMRRRDDSETRQMWRGMGEAWSTLSTLIAGVAVWGAIGLGLDRLFDTSPVLFVIGVLVGKFGAVYMIYVRASYQGERAEAERRAA